MKPRGTRWTADEVKILRDFCERNSTARQAAEVLDRPVTAIQGKAAALGLALVKEPHIRRSKRDFEEAVRAEIPPAPRYASRTAMMFGDPPIGRSALDQKRAGR